MKKKNSNTVTSTILLLLILCLPKYGSAHEMQHGFILSKDDRFASHLVASGHHSHQVDIEGELLISDPEEKEFYEERKKQSEGKSYFLLQAQALNLPEVKRGQILKGHIIESPLGQYEPQNRIVTEGHFKIKKVFINIPNPFFGNLKGEKREKVRDSRHCCEIPGKRCNWKC
jgi:hypothetical protein